MPVDEVREALDRAVPSYDGRSGDWHGVVTAARSSIALAALAEPRRRRWRPAFLVAVIAAIAVAGAVAILAAPWRDGPLATERALAALGHQPVVHAIVEQPSPHDIVIDLASGRERPGDAHRTEYWYDGERDTLRVRLFGGDKPLPGGEYLLSPEGFFTDRGVQRGQARPPQLDPALEGFASGYREALDSGKATVVGEEVVDGRAAVILRFALPPGPAGAPRPSEEVAVDNDNYRPLRYRFSATPDRILSWSEAPRVVEIETIPRDPRDFEPPQPGEPRPGGQTGIDERRLQPEEAASVLGRTVFWPGKAVEGVDLARIELMRLTTTWTNGRVTEGHALVFQYGVDRRTAHLEGKRSLTMTEGTSTEVTGPFNLGGSMPEPGALRLSGVGKTDSGEPEIWFGAMQRDGVYISFESPERDLIIAAAKSMMPLG